ncbi:MAG: hypothetical protein RR272_00525 [Synergistaceae bacterium]
MKKILITLAVLVALFSTMAFAASNKKVIIEEIEYNGKGEVEIDVKDTTTRKTNIIWTEQETLSVRDSSGKNVPAVFVKDDNDTYKLHIQNAKQNETYTFQLNNVQVGEHRGVDLEGIVKTINDWKVKNPDKQQTKHKTTPVTEKGKLYIHEIEFEHGNEVEIEFRDSRRIRCNITWNDTTKITVSDLKGKHYKASIIGYDNDDIKLRVDGLTNGEKYRVKLENIPFDNTNVTLETEFVAVEGWKYKSYNKKAQVQATSGATQQIKCNNEHLNLYIKKIEFNYTDQLNVDFNDVRTKDCNIYWNKGEKINVKDAQKKVYPVKIITYDNDDITLQVRGLTKGQTYTVSFENLKYDAKNTTLKAEFVATDGWKAKDYKHHK